MRKPRKIYKKEDYYGETKTPRDPIMKSIFDTVLNLDTEFAMIDTSYFYKRVEYTIFYKQLRLLTIVKHKDDYLFITSLDAVPPAYHERLYIVNYEWAFDNTNWKATVRMKTDDGERPMVELVKRILYYFKELVVYPEEIGLRPMIFATKWGIHGELGFKDYETAGHSDPENGAGKACPEVRFTQYVLNKKPDRIKKQYYERYVGTIKQRTILTQTDPKD